MFEKKIRTEKIIQFGEGGFLRGFVDWIVQLTNEASDFNASVVVVQPIENGMCQKLEEQNCVYTHVMRGMKNGVPTVEKKIIDVISRTVEPYRDFEAYLALADNPDFRFIVSNTTESGITFKDTDKIADAPAVTFPAKLTLLLKRRYEKGLRGFIFLPCELIDRNGDNLKACVLKYHILEGEPPLGHVLGDVEHRQLVGLLPAQLIDDIEGEIELFLTLEGNAGQDAALGGAVDELAVNSRLLVGSTPLGLGV